MRVLLVGEGPTDVGIPIEDEKGKPRYYAKGMLQPLLEHAMEKLAQTEKLSWTASDEFKFVCKTYKDVRRSTATGKVGKNIDEKVLGGRGLMLIARDENCDRIAYHMDDDYADKRSRKLNKRHPGKIDSTYRRNVVDERLSFPRQEGMTCLTIVPVHTSEAWMLADSEAFERAFGGSFAKNPPKLAKRPEEYWGDVNDPKSNHPKCVVRHLLDEYKGRKMPEEETEKLGQLAEAVDVGVLKERSSSFRQLVQELPKFMRGY